MDYLLHHVFISSLHKFPNKVAVKDNFCSLTYSQLAERSGCVAALLHKAGIRISDRVSFYLEHTVEQAIVILAISSVGAVFIPINWALYPHQVKHILSDSGSRFFITTKKLIDALEDDIHDHANLEKVFLTEDITGHERLERSSPAIESDLACLLYTSGSTGSPKGVMLSHKNLLSGCHIVSDYLKLSERDRLLGVLQLSFDYGLNQLITMLALGGTYRFLSYFVPNEIVRALHKDAITGFAGIPQIWTYLMRSSLGKTPLPDLRYISNSGGQIPENVIEFLKQSLPSTDIVLMYGLTEAFRSTYLKPSELENHPASMGKAIPDTEILVVSEQGKLCGPNEEGELVHRGPTVSLGYWNRPEETAAVFREFSLIDTTCISGERVVYSGDLVRYDEDGFLYFVGRRDAMIKSSGIRVSPTEIEEVVYNSGLVKEAAAIGVQDLSLGQAIMVFVVLFGNGRKEAQEIEEQIIDYCSRYLPNYMMPKYMEILTSLPKTPHNKIDYPALKERVKICSPRKIS